MTVQLVPEASSFMSLGGKHTGNKWSWNATRVANLKCEWNVWKEEKKATSLD